MNTILKKFLTKIRYILFGKAIMYNMRKAEQAGRETSDYAHEVKLANLEAQHNLELDTKVREMFSTLNHAVNPDHVVTKKIDKLTGKITELMLGNNVASSIEVGNLKSEVAFLRNSRIWQLINNTLKQQAEDIMFKNSKSFEDMVAGKYMLYNLSVQDTILKTIEDFNNK